MDEKQPLTLPATRETMSPGLTGESEYHFLTASGAHVECRLARCADGQELQLFGNRSGMLSLANVLLWLSANASQREFLSLGEVGFARLDLPLAVCIRVCDGIDADTGGVFSRLDQADSLEWVISEAALTKLALCVHHLASVPTHEYERVSIESGIVCAVHFRLTDAAEWIQFLHP